MILIRHSWWIFLYYKLDSGKLLYSTSISALPNCNLVFITVFGIEKCFDGIRTISRYLDISPQNSGYGCDISIYRISWYRMMCDMISRSIAIYHATSHRITPKHQAKTTSTKPTTLLRSTICFWLMVCVLFLACLPSGLVWRPSVVHQLDTSYLQDWPYHSKQ